MLFLLFILLVAELSIDLFTEKDDEDDDEDDDEEEDDDDEDDGGVRLRLDTTAAAFDEFVSLVDVAVISGVASGVLTGVGLTFSKKLKSFKSGNNI